MTKTSKHPGESRPTPTLIDMGEVCNRASIDRATGWRWLKAGILPAPTIKVGRVVRWNASAIEAWFVNGVTA